MHKNWLRAIAILEITGGAIGILFCIYMSFAAGFAFSAMVIIPITLGIFILSLVAGIYLWKDTPLGRKASIVVQCIQLPKLASPSITFMYSFGFDMFPHVTLMDNYATVGAQFRFLADGQLFTMTEGSAFLMGVSIPATIALVKLWDHEPADKNANRLGGKDGPPPPDEYFGLNDQAD